MLVIPFAFFEIKVGNICEIRLKSGKDLKLKNVDIKVNE